MHMCDEITKVLSSFIVAIIRGTGRKKIKFNSLHLKMTKNRWLTHSYRIQDKRHVKFVFIAQELHAHLKTKMRPT